jgi:sodium transport system permease protein
MGVMLGWVALRTGSVLPGILIHFTNNALSVSLSRIAESDWGGASLLLMQTESGPAYQPMWTLVSIGVSVTCLLYFSTIRPAPGDDAEPDLAEPAATPDSAASLAPRPA